MVILRTSVTVGNMSSSGGEEFWLGSELIADRALNTKNFATDLKFQVC